MGPKLKHKLTSGLAEDVLPAINLYDSVLHRALPLVLVSYHLHALTFEHHTGNNIFQAAVAKATINAHACHRSG